MNLAVLSRLASIVFTPSDLLGLLLLAGVILLSTRLRRLGHAILIGVVVALTAVFFLPVDRWLAEPLENQFPRPAWPHQVDGIVVLGGGENGAILAARGVPAPDPNENRLIAGADLARRYPEARLIFSGGTATFENGILSEAAVARAVYAQIGLPPTRVIMDSRSRNTWENLVNSKQIAKPKADETWMLVTSAKHLPRAMGVASKLHWKMVPWAADYTTMGQSQGTDSWNASLALRLAGLEATLHEWAGLAAYRLTGRWAPQ
jgi:uncharacterized SAM-binding protein YcdF (DUF218 family)